MNRYVDVVATIEGRREARVLLKAEGRTDAIWVDRGALMPASQILVTHARLGEVVEIKIEHGVAEQGRFL